MRMSLASSANRMLRSGVARSVKPMAMAAMTPARQQVMNCATPMAVRTFVTTPRALSGGAPVFLEVEPKKLVSFVENFGPEEVALSKSIIVNGTERSNISDAEWKAYFKQIDPNHSFFSDKEIQGFLNLWNAKDLSHPKESDVEEAQATVQKLVAVWQGLIDREQNRMIQDQDYTNWLDTDLLGIALTIWRAGPYGSKPYIFGPGTDNFIPNAFEQSTGLERLDHVLNLVGQKAFDHDGLKTPEVYPSKHNPIEVPISETKRVVACRGWPAGSHLPRYFELKKNGPMHRCTECGSAFKPKYTGVSDESLAFWNLIVNGVGHHH